MFARGVHFRPWNRLTQRRMFSFPSRLPDSAFAQSFEFNDTNEDSNTPGGVLRSFCEFIDQTALSATSAYELTMPLLTASQLGSACWNILQMQPGEMITRLIHLMEEEVFAGSMTPGCEAWLRGRILLACDSCGMKDYPRGYGLIDLSRLIDNANNVKLDTENASMFCWGRSYLMQSLGRMEACDEYLRRRNLWLDSVLTSVQKSAELQSRYSSDQMWSITCGFAAAGQAKDREAYDKLLSALAPGAADGVETLCHNIPVSDFRAWAVSLLSVAAVQVEDMHTYTTARECMAIVHESQHSADRALAIANFAFSDFLFDFANERSVQAGGEGWEWSRESAEDCYSALADIN